VRSLTPAAAAASASDQLSSRTRPTISLRLFGQSGHYRAASFGVLLGTEWLQHLSASKEARMNNVPRNYT